MRMLEYVVVLKIGRGVEVFEVVRSAVKHLNVLSLLNSRQQCAMFAADSGGRERMSSFSVACCSRTLP